MDKKKLSFPVLFQPIKNYTVEDDRFTKVKIWLMHLGENFNGSVFEKESVDSALESLEYIPIVGFIEKNKQNEDDFSDHRYVTIKTDNGNEKKYMGIPYGVIKSTKDNNAHYEDRLCDDGITRTFLVVDGLIWNMFKEGSEIVNRDLIKAHSMELFDDENSIEGYEDENGLFHFTKFSFRAACILGKDYEPAMINSTIEVQFTVSDFVKDIQKELKEKITTFNRIEGGEKLPKIKFTQTAMELFEDISSIVSDFAKTKNRWGDEYPRYYLRDIQESTVIVIDREDHYRTYGMNFTIENDKPIVDFSTAKRKKITYTDYEDGESIPDNEIGFDFGKHIEEIEISATSKIEKFEADLSEAAAEFSKVENELNEIKPKYENYVANEKKVAKEADRQKKKDIFSTYEAVLSENNEFNELKEKMEDFSFKDIENKVFSLYAKTVPPQSNFTNSSNLKVSLGIMDDYEKNDGVTTSRYGKMKKFNK